MGVRVVRATRSVRGDEPGERGRRGAGLVPLRLAVLAALAVACAGPDYGAVGGTEASESGSSSATGPSAGVGAGGPGTTGVSGTSATTGPSGGGDDTSAQSSGTNGSGGSGGSGGQGPVGSGKVRFAHLSPDGPLLNGCIRPTGTPIGSLPVATFSSFAFPQVGAYVDVPPGNYDVDIAWVGTDCAQPALVIASVFNINDGQARTVSVVGMRMPSGPEEPLQVVSMGDDLSAPPEGKARVRFVHAVPDVAGLDGGVLDQSGSVQIDIWEDVGFGDVGVPMLVSDAMTAEPSLQEMSSPAILAAFDRVDHPTGSIVDIFAIGLAGAMGPPDQLALMVCTVGGNCVLPQRLP
jgi:hypothetical protein